MFINDADLDDLLGFYWNSDIFLNTLIKLVWGFCRMERKLSTILALDVVGFSKLMATDEDMTLAILRQLKQNSKIKKKRMRYYYKLLPNRRYL